MSGVPAGRCEACGQITFPRGLLCPACGGREQEVELDRGTVLDVTTVFPRDGSGPIELALVALRGAGNAVARTCARLGRGEEVTLRTNAEGRIEAHPIESGASA